MEAIKPIWEANHVWLIVAVTLLFTAFPRAFSRITTVLHIPLTLLLIGIVLRGSAFVFRSHDARSTPAAPVWGGLFASSSLLAPLLLGMAIGSIASGRVKFHEGDFIATFLDSWLAPFPFAVGLLTLSWFAMLAAIYLCVEVKGIALKEDFRRRALGATVLAGTAGTGVLLLARTEAPEVWDRFFEHPGTWLVIVLAGALITATIAALRRHAYRLARLLAAAQVTVMLWGWAWAQYPMLVEPDLSISNSAAPASTLRFVLAALVAGAFLLFPSLYYLYRIFKGGTIFSR
jgi:cytochrome d ubiquinol oxidase subunit II